MLRPWLASLVISGGLTLVVVIAILVFTGWVMALATANERTQQELAAQTKRADAASRAKSDFLATMSHEVRTPMTGIIGYSDLLFQAEPDPKLKEYARVVGDSARALLSILDDILDLSIIEAGRLTLREGPLDPVEIVADAVAIITAGARDKGVVTATHVDADVPRNLIGDRDRLRQVVANLLGNAVKFTERGRIDVSVERLGQVDGGEEIRISVADTGIGIPKQDLGRLFQRFTQVDNSIARRFGGTGLGLAICKNLVERMGGRIGVDSSPAAAAPSGSPSPSRSTPPSPRSRKRRHPSICRPQVASWWSTTTPPISPWSKRCWAPSATRWTPPGTARSRSNASPPATTTSS